MVNFWSKLKKPFLVLAPMEDVTDVVFREIVAGLPRPDVFFTEFTNAEGLSSKGFEAVIPRLKYTENQRPIVAQIWGTSPEYMSRAAALVGKLGFDGIDINMGCPDKAVVKKGAGAGQIGNFALVTEIIKSVKQAAPELAVSVKTRLGYDRIITGDWVSFLLQLGIDALTVHGRIATQMSKGEADWSEIGKAVKLRDKLAPATVIIGNGDVKNYREVWQMHEKYLVDGVMIGRGIFTNPWVFEKTLETRFHDRESYLKILSDHLSLFDRTWKNSKRIDIMKKFFKMYVRDFDGANELRQRLMECKNADEVKQILKSAGQ